MLTHEQKRTLEFLIRYQADNGGISPTFDEIAQAVELKSKSGVSRLIVALEERGFIRRMEGRARAIEVVRLPNGQNANSYKPGANTQDRGLFEKHYAHATKRDRLPIIRVPKTGKLPPILARICLDGKIGHATRAPGPPPSNPPPFKPGGIRQRALARLGRSS